MSNDRISPGRGLLEVRVRAAGAETREGPSFEAPEEPCAASKRGSTRGPGSCVPLFLGNLEELQQRAFERGREVEREESGAAIRKTCQGLSEMLERLLAEQQRERGRVGEFAVALACAVAELVVGPVLEAGQHDVRGLVARLLKEVLPEARGEEIVLEGHPSDVERLRPEIQRSEYGVSVQLVPDPALQQGEFRVRTPSLCYWSGAREHLELVRKRLLEELEEGHAA